MGTRGNTQLKVLRFVGTFILLGLIFLLGVAIGVVGSDESDISPCEEPHPDPITVSVSLSKQETLAKDITSMVSGADLFLVEAEPCSDSMEVADDLDELEGEALIDSYIYELCSIYTNVDPEIVRSIVWHESRYQPDIVNSIGCSGLMQLNKKWFADRMIKLGIKDILDPYSNLWLGIDYLSELYTNYKDDELVLMLYNMKWSSAFELYKNGKISMYAQSVIDRANWLRSGGE